MAAAGNSVKTLMEVFGYDRWRAEFIHAVQTGKIDGDELILPQPTPAQVAAITLHRHLGLKPPTFPDQP